MRFALLFLQLTNRGIHPGLLFLSAVEPLLGTFLLGGEALNLGVFVGIGNGLALLLVFHQLFGTL
ncbi:MAG: hypothetical protein HN348_34470 [Proteobacteria bacterium]|nr:hypothetical protein [Pseudomonadota bacterium]